MEAGKLKALLICLSLAFSYVKTTPIPWSDLMTTEDFFGGDMIGVVVPAEDDPAIAIKPHAGGSFWPNNLIYYDLHSDAKAITGSLALIKDALNEISSKTVLRFQHRNGDASIANYVLVTVNSNQGCNSYVGLTNAGAQTLNLYTTSTSVGAGTCWTKSIIMHEFLHAVGFMHEHQRYDRATYIELQTSNIETGKESNFDLWPLASSTDVGSPYDFDSIMHYNSDAFGKPDPTDATKKLQTMVVKADPSRVILHTDRRSWFLSANDIDEINKVFGAFSPTTTTTTTTTTARARTATTTRSKWGAILRALLGK